jgi:hypothetical protein
VRGGTAACRIAALLGLLALAQIGGAAGQGLPPIAAPPVDPGTGPGLGAPPTSPDGGAIVARYGLTLVPGGATGSAVHLPYVLMLDTATGRTWVLWPLQGGGAQTMIWAPVPFLSPAGTASTTTPR